FPQDQRRSEIVNHCFDRPRDIISLTQADESVRGVDVNPKRVWMFGQAERLNLRDSHSLSLDGDERTSDAADGGAAEREALLIWIEVAFRFQKNQRPGNDRDIVAKQ